MSSTSNKFYLLFHTIKYLKAGQIFYRIFYTVKRKFIGKIPQNNNNLIANDKIQISKLSFQKSRIKNYSGRPEEVLKNTFEFISQKKNFGKKIDWHSPELNKGTRLWKLNLNYHEYIIEIAKEYSNNKEAKYLDYIQSHITEWWEQNPFGTPFYYKDNWNSYAISLRSIAWIKTYMLIGDSFDEDFGNKFLQSLKTQLYYLTNNLEYDLRGNHLLENAFALFFGSYFYNDTLLYEKAKKLLIEQINEQILTDGAHFELSPMYHQLMLYRVLDCLNLVKNNSNFNKELGLFLRKKSELMLGWLEQMTFKNGDIALFNDSAFNVNPTTRQLKEYAESIGVSSNKVNLSESGYRRFEDGKYELVVDVGNIGPDYIPGHAHSDTLGFVLYASGKPMLIDMGTSIYNAGERRNLERSTASHNTVMIGGIEQSECWASFRVAKRARAQIIEENHNGIKATHNGYEKIKANHVRQVLVDKGKLMIKDVVKKKKKHKAEAHFHFHPEQKINIKNFRVETSTGVLEFEGANKIEKESYFFAPEFNTLISAKKIIVEFDNTLETKINL